MKSYLNKVTPHQNSSNSINNNNNNNNYQNHEFSSKSTPRSELSSKGFDQSEDEMESTTSSAISEQISDFLSKNKKRNKFLGFLLSARLFLIVSIILLVSFSCLVIWLTSYITFSNYSTNNALFVMSELSVKFSLELNSELKKIKQVASDAEEDFSNGILSWDRKDENRKYILSRMMRYNLPIMNIILELESGPEMFTLVYQYMLNSETREYYKVEKREPGNKNDETYDFFLLDRNTAEKIEISNTITHNVSEQAYYVQSREIFKSYNQGAFGKPYQVDTFGIETFYSRPVSFIFLLPLLDS
jgi:hypothetical protein